MCMSSIVPMYVLLSTTLYSRLLILCFRDETTDPDGGLYLELDVDQCRIVPDSSLCPLEGRCTSLSGFLSHLLNLSLLRHNLLPLLFDVMLDHKHVISACNTTMSALFSRSYKD